MEKEIEDWRFKIDEIDSILTELFNRRAIYAIEIGRIKQSKGIPVYNPSREDNIFEHVQRINKGPLHNQAIKRLFERIIDETRRLEREVCEKGTDDGYQHET